MIHMRVEQNYLYLLLFQVPACVFLEGFNFRVPSSFCGFKNCRKIFFFHAHVYAVYGLRFNAFFALSTLLDQKHIKLAYSPLTLPTNPPFGVACSAACFVNRAINDCTR